MRRTGYLLCVWSACILLVIGLSSAVSAQQPPPDIHPIHDALGAPHIYALPNQPEGDSTRILSDVSPLWAPPDPGKSCVDYNFEGGGDLAPIPSLEGINFPDWLTIIDADVGGSGNFANEPSPSTVGFWLGGALSVHEIVFDEPVSEVEFYYASYYSVSFSAYDEDGVIIDSDYGFANYGLGVGDPTGDYNVWTPLMVSSDGNKIKRVDLTGYANYTGIDDLRVCKSITIEGVEFTQAVQQYQTVDDLQTSLSSTGQPPVPLVAHKLMAVRVYVQELDKSEDVRVRLSGSVTTRTSNLQTLQVKCPPDKQRLGTSLDPNNHCRSIDMLVAPPEGAWSITVELLNKNNDVLDSQTFDLNSLTTEPLELATVKVCLRRNNTKSWVCTDPNAIGGLIGVLQRIAPTDVVYTSRTTHTSYEQCDDYDDNNDGILPTTPGHNLAYPLWKDLTGDIADARSWDYWLLELADILDTRGYGLVPTSMNSNADASDNCDVGYGGLAYDIGGGGAASLDSLKYGNLDITAETVAHETGHMLNSEHTAKEGGFMSAAPPGCFSQSFSNHPAASPATLETGYDVLNFQNPIRPSYDSGKRKGYFDIMSYCGPRWVSVRTYQSMLSALHDGIFAGPSRFTIPTYYGQFWTVGGTLDGGTLALDPLFQVEVTGSDDPGVGSYAIQVRAADNSVLFTRAFTPDPVEIDETGGPQFEIFSELVPVQAGAAQIVVLDPSAAIIGAIPISGIAPTVDITTTPSGTLSGSQTFNWTVTDPDGGDQTSWIQYSPNGDTAGSWFNINTHLHGSSFTLDFDQLPGSSGNGYVRVYVTDGSNTGSDMVGPFSVPNKLPTAQITDPVDGAVFNGNGVTLTGSAYDEDDGYLHDSALQWSSSIGGALGSGDLLGLFDLVEGVHTVTLTATDSDSNVATDTVTFTVDRTQPTFSLDVVPDGIPTQCVDVTISASDALSGLDIVQLSYDGGTNWADIPLAELPYNFQMPGYGFFHLVARAIDKAGNVIADDARFIIDTPCGTVVDTELLTTVLLGGRASPPDSVNSQPYRLVVYLAGETTPIFDQYLTTDENGHFLLYATPGTYTFWIKHDQGLAAIQTRTLLSGSQELDFGALRVGDADNSNAVTITDFAILAATFGKTSGIPGYDGRADFNGDGAITILDFSLLAASFGQTGATLPG